jgi:HEAT repeat protein
LYCTNKVESDIEKLRSTQAFYHPGKLHPVIDRIYYIRRSALGSLGKIAAGHQMGINRLKQILDSMRYQASRIEAASILWKINLGDSMTITVLREILLNTDNQWVFEQAISILENIATNDHRAIDILLEIYRGTHDEEIRRIVCESLGKIGTANQIAIDGLKEILHTNQNDETRKEAAESLGIIDPGNTTAIETLETLLLDPTTNQRILLLAATSLEKINHGNSIAFEKLKKLCTSKNEDFRLEAAERLWKINPENPIVIEIVIETLIQIAFINPEYEENEIEASEFLGEIAKQNKIIVDKLIQLMHIQSDTRDRAVIADILGKTDSGKHIAIEELDRILNFCKDDNICWAVAECLGEISPNCSKAITALIEILNSSETSYSRKQEIIQKLGQIGLENEAAIQELIKILCASQDDVLSGFAAEGLQKIRQHKFMVMTVTGLKKNLEDEFDERDFSLDKERCEVLFHCAQNMPYPAFYQAWHP